MIKGGTQRTPPITYIRKNGTEGEYSKPIIKNAEIFKISKVESICSFIEQQQENWIGHIIRADDESYIKRMTFADYPKNEPKKRGLLSTTYGQVLKRYKEDNLTENDMINGLKGRKSRAVTALEHNSND